MPNYRYSPPEYMRCGNHIPRQTAYSAEKAMKATDPIAMAYVPWQEWTALYTVEEGLHHGTIFEELYKPFCKAGGCS